MPPPITIVHGVLGPSVPADRAGSRQVARVQLDHGLRWLGLPTPAGHPARGATGRPSYFDAGFDYSCSHDRGVVAVATSTGRVGIDALASRVTAPHIWSFLHCRSPRTRARHAPGLGRLRLEDEALVLWTRFEAEVKFRGGSVWQEWASTTSGREAPAAPAERLRSPTIHSWTIRDGATDTFLSVATAEDEAPPLALQHANGEALDVYAVAISDEPTVRVPPTTRTEPTPAPS